MRLFKICPRAEFFIFSSIFPKSSMGDGPQDGHKISSNQMNYVFLVINILIYCATRLIIYELYMMRSKHMWKAYLFLIILINEIYSFLRFQKKFFFCFTKNTIIFLFVFVDILQFFKASFMIQSPLKKRKNKSEKKCILNGARDSLNGGIARVLSMMPVRFSWGRISMWYWYLNRKKKQMDLNERSWFYNSDFKVIEVQCTKNRQYSSSASLIFLFSYITVTLFFPFFKLCQVSNKHDKRIFYSDSG